MAGKSLPPVSAKIIADAEQFIAEFRRAERAAQGSTTRVGAEVDKMAKTLGKKFSLGDIGKDLLKGLGLGSGFALAQQAGELISGHFERAAKAAQDMEAATGRQLENTKELIRLHQTDEQAVAALNNEYEAESKRLAELQKPRTITTTMRRKVFGDYETVTNTVLRDRTADENKELNAQIELVQKLEIARGQLAQKDKAAESAAAAKTLAATIATAQEEGDMLSRRMAGMEEGRRLRNQEAEELERLAAKYKEVADPTKRFTDQIAEAKLVAEAFPEKANKMADAIENITRAMVEDEERRVDSSLNNFFGPLDEKQKELDAGSKKTAKAAQDLGWAFSSAFEDAILSGDKFSDVLKGLGQDILRIAIRTAITQPIGAAIGGLFSSGLGAAFTGIFGGGKAVGGPVSAGTTYMVGEEGPEMFTPRTNGSIIPNDKLGGGSGGGNTYVFNLPGGVSESVFQQFAQVVQSNLGPGQIERRALTAISSARRRGYSY